MNQAKIATYVLIILTGMMVASLAAYVLLTTFGFSAKRLSGEQLPSASAAMVTGVVTAITHEASSTIFTLKTDTGTTTVLVKGNSTDCPAVQNIVDVSAVAEGDTLSARGSKSSEGIVPCRNSNDYVKVIKNTALDTTIATTSKNIYSNGVERRAAAPATSTAQAVVSTKFTGTLQSIDTGCFADGECFAMVDGKHITVLRGWSRDTVGSVLGVPSFGDLASHVGANVEVRAAIQDDGTYTLYGDSTYYIKLLP